MTPDENTLDLLRGWHAGDREALDALMRKNLGWVRERVHRRLGEGLRRDAETQDFVQDAMLEVLEYGPRFEVSNANHFRGLLARIVENCLRMENRRLHQQRRDVRKERRLGGDTVLSLDPPRKQVTRPSEHADRNERVAWVQLGLELLKPGDREVIWLHEMEGKTFKEISQVIETTEEGARIRFQRALPKLLQQVARLRSGELGAALDDAAG